jgi:signal transduction histidine kinase
MHAIDPVEFALDRKMAERIGFRAALIAPMLRDNVGVGAIVLHRHDPGAFPERQIRLLESFAAQAVIAIQNVRLFTELRESLEQQTATSEILQVISQSPTDVQPVLDVVAKAARRFCGATDALITLRDGDHMMRIAAHEGPLFARLGSVALDPTRLVGLAIVEGRTSHLPDVEAADPEKFAKTIELGREIGFKAAVAAPLLLESGAVGSIVLRKSEAGAFTPRQIELLETFAAQAVIAIENVRLFTELRESLERLKAAQANLIQSEKMASLGQLTAGIAHEIKNPLNFVNNFADLSSELLEELRQAVDVLLVEPDQERRAELQDTIDLLTGNLAKIVEHGKRADGIVKSMLAHSRGGTGDWQSSSLNGLIDEALNLAYHGARAQDKDFNVTLERDFADGLTPIDVVPQDVTRVFLNLVGNGFYATRKRQRDGADSNYRPTLKVSTRDLGDRVEIRVRDNGTGIPPEVRDRLFQPFFTTKPTGEGTGLGLSISYDIVTQQHGGTIEVESEPGQFTEFTVRLPRARRAAASGGG